MAKAVLKNAGSALTRFASTLSPDVKEKALAYVSSAVGGKVEPAKVAIEASKGTPNGVALMVDAFAAAGHKPEDFLSKGLIEQMYAAGLGQIVDNAKATFQSIYGAIDKTSLFRATNARDTGEELYIKGVIRWAAGQFGDGKAIKRHHVMLKSFIEMDEDTIDHAIALHL